RGCRDHPGTADRRTPVVCGGQRGRLAHDLRPRRGMADEQGHRSGVTGTSVLAVTTGPTDQQTGIATERPVGRLGPLFAGIWLFFLINPLADGWQHRDEVRGIVGMASTIAFAVVYMTLWFRARADRQQLIRDPELSWSLPYVGALVALGAITVVCLGESGLA